MKPWLQHNITDSLRQEKVIYMQTESQTQLNCYDNNKGVFTPSVSIGSRIDTSVELWCLEGTHWYQLHHGHAARFPPSSSTLHGVGRARHSEWPENSFIKVVYEKII